VNATRLVICLIASIPAGWLAGALFERIPSRRPLWKPFPRYHLGGINLTLQVLITGLYALAAVRFPEENPLVLAAYLVFFLVSVVLAMIDIDTLRLPDAIVGGALVVSIPLITAGSLAASVPEQIQYALLGGACYFGFLLIAHLIFGNRGMGFGDVKLAALLGLFLGWVAPSGHNAVVYVMYAALAGFVVGAGVGIVLVAVRGRSRSYPMGPFLIGGALLVVAFSTQLATGAT
jgi:leader peptidase (prepilin peptidase)/N-methyltransferase